MKNKTLRKVRKKIGLTKLQYARLLRLSLSYIEKLEDNRRRVTDNVETRVRNHSGLSEREINRLDMEVSD